MMRRPGHVRKVAFMRSGLRLVAFTAIACLVWQTRCLALQPPESPEAKQEGEGKGQQLLRRLIAAREAINSAECSVAAKIEHVQVEECQYQSAFDSQQDRLRFEHFSERQQQTVFVRTRTDAFLFSEQSSTIELLNPKSATPLPRVRPFDARAIGVQGFGGFTTRKQLADLRGDLNKLSISDVHADPQDANLTVLLLETSDGEIKGNDSKPLFVKSTLTYWIDERQGYRVPKYKSTFRLSDDPTHQSWQPERVQELTTTQWREEGGLQLPEKCVMINGPDEKTPSRLTLSLHWAVVNRPTDPTRFTIESLQAKPGTKILDRR